MIRERIIRKYQEIQAVLDEDLRTTLSHLEMEERAAVSALDGLMERNCSLIQEIEQDLARLTVTLEQTDTEPDTMVMNLDSGKVEWTKYDLKCHVYLLICVWEVNMLCGVKHCAFKVNLSLIVLLFFSLSFHTLSSKTWTQWTGMKSNHN